MRSPIQRPTEPPLRRFAAPLAISIGVAAAALLAVASASAAQRGMSSVSTGPMLQGGPRGPIQSGGDINRFEPAFQNLNSAPGSFGSMRGNNGRGKGTDVSNDGPSKPPGHRPPRGKRPPGWYADGPPPGVTVTTIGPPGAPPPRRPSAGAPPPRGKIFVPPGNEQRFVKDQVVLEFAGDFPAPGIAQLLARHGLQQIEAQSFALTNSTYVLAHIAGRNSVRATLRRLGGEAILRTGQPNMIYRAAQDAATQAGPAATIPLAEPAMPRAVPVVASAGAVPAAGDPAQYVLGKLRLNEAHALATGDKVLVAVIDSGIDLGHPELQGKVAGSFDALGKAERPHPHGTAIAGAIAAHARLLGAAPAARILAIRAFGSAGESAEATTFAILKGIEYAVAQNARVINMSFAGPADPGLSRHLAAANGKGAVLIAAAGNFGPTSPAQYPAADPHVIAVSATDANDQMFRASNVGPHIAVAAPGVDLLLPAPNNDYQLSSGTSFSAAYVSGVAALVLQRAPALTPDAVRRTIEATAKDLGPRGKDRQYGAGLVDAYRAITAVETTQAAAPIPQPKPALAR